MTAISPVSESLPGRFDALMTVAGLPPFGVTVLCEGGQFVGLEMYDPPSSHLMRCMADRLCIYAATLCVKAQLSGAPLASVLSDLPVHSAFDGERALVGHIISSVFANACGLTGRDEGGSVRVGSGRA